MLDDDELRKLSQGVRREAQEVLRHTNIEQALKDHGSVHLIGSYAYDVMLERDIDFHVIVPKLNSSLAAKLFEWAASSAMFEYISFHDKHRFNEQAAVRYAAKSALDSYYFSLRLQVNDAEWQIGVNFITAPQEASEEIVALMKRMTNEQCKQILRFKYQLHQQHVQVSSAFIYRAVIEQSIVDSRALVAYLRTLGYQIPDIV